MTIKFNYKTYTKILSLFCILCILVGSNIVYAQNDDKSEKQYVIITENADKTTDLISDKKIEDVCENKKSPDIVVANLTENQADKIENKDFVICVEEDITLTGSFDEEGKKNVEKTKTDDLNQWYLDAIGVEKTEKPKSQVKVALLDSGVSYTDDVDVEENVNFVDDTSINPLFVDGNGHGSALASVICAKDNGEGITGVNPNVCLYSAKVLDDENKAPLSRIIQGIYWAIDNNVDIINMSFGTSVNTQALHNAIKQVAKKDILMIAAAGNTKHKDVQYPAAYNEVIAVGSTNTNGELSENTSSGTELELVAPGEKIIANGFLSMPEVVSGTSIATAQVTGVASLLLQKDLSKSADFIRQLLKTSAKEVKYGVSQTAGLVDYSYANNIYNKFAEEYQLGKFNTVNLKNIETPEDYTADTKDISVDGLWAENDHEQIVNKCNDSLNANKLNIVKEYCTVADKCFPSKDKSQNFIMNLVAMHGAGNYVVHMEYLWYFAVFLGRYDKYMTDKTGKNFTITTTSQMNDAINYARNQAKAKIENSPYYKNKYSNDPNNENYSYALSQLINNSGTMIKTGKDSNNIYKKQSNIVLSSTTMKYRALGYMLHLNGDVYAHQTVVPTTVGIYENYHTDKSSLGSRISKADFVDQNQIEELKSRILKGNLRFVELKSYFDDENDKNRTPIANSKYIDCTDFVKNRYINAESLGKKIIKTLTGGFDYANFICPVKGDDVKLYEFKSHVKQAGLNTGSLTDSEWAKYSTN